MYLPQFSVVKVYILLCLTFRVGVTKKFHPTPHPPTSHVSKFQNWNWHNYGFYSHCRKLSPLFLVTHPLRICVPNTFLISILPEITTSFCKILCFVTAMVMFCTQNIINMKKKICVLLHSFFFYKNNFIRTTRLRFG